MRTTLNLEDALYRRVKVKAAREGRTVKDVVETALRSLVGDPAMDTPEPRRVRLPLIPARPGRPRLFQGMTTEEIHDRLAGLETDVERAGPDDLPA